MNPMQQNAVGNLGSPSAAIPSTPALRRSSRLSTRARTPKMAPPARMVAMTKAQRLAMANPPAVKANPAFPKKSPKRKLEEPPGPEEFHSYFLGLGGVPPTPTPTQGSPSKRGRRADVVVVPYHGTERRARPWRDSPPDSYLDRVDRINRSRMFIVGQSVRENDDEVPEFYFDVVGSTGNIYNVKIGKLPSCDCPDGKMRCRGECKHIIYVLLKALNARSELQYQISFVPSELREMYEGSLMSMFEDNGAADHDHDGKRKPLDGACPICFMDFETKDKTVWCQTGCGNNVHEVCFKQWARASLTSQGSIRCVYCRTSWPSPGSKNPNVENLRKNGTIGREGYINVAEQFGLSPKRGSSKSSSSLIAP